MDNLVEPVTKELDFQLQTPFLLYRNHAGDIYGIWFYEQVGGWGGWVWSLLSIVAG